MFIIHLTHPDRITLSILKAARLMNTNANNLCVRAIPIHRQPLSPHHWSQWAVGIQVHTILGMYLGKFYEVCSQTQMVRGTPKDIYVYFNARCASLASLHSLTHSLPWLISQTTTSVTRPHCTPCPYISRRTHSSTISLHSIRLLVVVVVGSDRGLPLAKFTIQV